MCSFISRTRDSVVRAVSVQDILQGNVRLPFTSRTAWFCVQSECPDLRRTHAHLVQGTRPSKKLTNIRDVKRYLQVASVAHDGLLVVRRHEPLSSSRECIIVPRQALDGLLTALHIQRSHPSCHQLKWLSNATCTLSIWTRLSLVSLMDAIPAQQSEALQSHVLTSPIPHFPTLLVGPLPQTSLDAHASLFLSSARLSPPTIPILLRMSVIKRYAMPS